MTTLQFGLTDETAFLRHHFG